MNNNRRINIHEQGYKSCAMWEINQKQQRVDLSIPSALRMPFVPPDADICSQP
jgi:hypothetical protein